MPPVTTPAAAPTGRPPADASESAGWPKRIGLFALALAVMYAVTANNIGGITPATVAWAVVFILVAALPVAVTLIAGYRTALPIHMLNVFYYAFAIGYYVFRVVRDPRYWVSEGTTNFTLQLATLGVATQMAAYWAALRLLGRVRPIRFTAGMSDGQLQAFGWVMVAVRLLNIAFPALSEVPSLGQFVLIAPPCGVAILYARWLQGRLPLYQAALLLAVFVPLELAVRMSTGLLAQPLLLGLLFVLVRWGVQRRIAWTFLIVAVAVYAVLAPVKGEYRRITWGEPAGVRTSSEKLELFFDLAERYWVRGVLVVDEDAEQSAIERFAALHIFTLVVDRTPGTVPYWGGETLQLAGYSFIPRIVWPDKPFLSVGNVFGHRYGILDPDDDSTAVNLPWIVELYANYGSPGVVIGMGVFGLLFALLERLLSGVGATTLDRVLGIALTYGLCFPESNIALMWGGVLLSITVVYLCCRVMYSLRA